MFVVLVAVTVLCLPADIAVTVGNRQAALVIQDTRFDPAVQLMSELTLGVGLRSGRAPAGTAYPGPAAFLAGGVAVGLVSQSRALSGYVYRGLATRSIWLSGAWASRSGVGIELTARAVLASYQLTSLLSFYPEVEIAPTFATARGERYAIEWSAPIFTQFRRDLTYAIGFGISGRLALEISSP